MIRKSRLVVALGLVLALAVAGVAFATGAEENNPTVLGKISPKKLDKKEFKAVKLFAGVATEPQRVPSCGGGAAKCNPEKELIRFPKDMKWKSNAAPFCTASLSGLTTEQARAACPEDSALGTGSASLRVPSSTGGTRDINDLAVTAFNGPVVNEVRLQYYSPTLGASAAAVITGKIVGAGKAGFNRALSVEDAPDAAGDVGFITSFNTTINKTSGVVLARCKADKFKFERTVTYDDGSTETAPLVKQACQRKGGGGGGGGN